MRNLQLSAGDGPILVLVPHEDDEIILFGGLIRRATSLGVPATVALVTNGDYGDSDGSIGRARLRESLCGLSDLGLAEENVVFLGYADTGMQEKESFLAGLYAEPDATLVHPSHGGTNTYGLPPHPDFHTQRFGKPASYTRNNLTGDLTALLGAVQPTRIFTTHPADAHGDHAALFRFVQALPPQAEVYCGFAHSPLGDAAWPLPGERFTCPPNLDAQWRNAVSLALTEREREAKRLALSRHVTALKPDAIEYLYAFIKQAEVYFPLEAVR